MDAFFPIAKRLMLLREVKETPNYSKEKLAPFIEEGFMAGSAIDKREK